MKVFYFDVETTGFSAEKNDIIQLAGIVEEDGKVLGEIDLRMQPFDYATIRQEALDVNGVTVEELQSFGSPDAALIRLETFLLNYMGSGEEVLTREEYDVQKFLPMGYTVKFDIRFLKAFFIKCGSSAYGSFFLEDFIDVLDLVKAAGLKEQNELANNKLVTVAEFFGIELNAHEAMSDIKATREIKILLEERCA